MSQWVIKGIRTGIKTTLYPEQEETAPGTTPGLPTGGYTDADAVSMVQRCPADALSESDGKISVDQRRCVHCYRCVRGVERPLAWQAGYEWAQDSGALPCGNGLGPAFRRSIHILVVDAGDCGACLNEVKQLNNPYYNMHRLGFFITPSPRHADVLLVVGAGTDHMRVPLKKIYDAMPAPKRVVAVGSCALSGGLFSESFVCASGIAEILPVDVEVPGHPPPPLAILHGLLVASGRKKPVPNSTDSQQYQQENK